MAKLPPGWFTFWDQRAYRILAEQVPPGGTVLEIGCWLGRSLCSIAPIIRSRQLKVIAVDPFYGPMDKGIEPWMNRVLEREGLSERFRLVMNPKKFTMKSAVELARKNFIDFEIDVELRIGESDTLVSTIADESIDLLFIDGDHDTLRNDVLHWWPKVRSNGIMAGHDFLVGSSSHAYEVTRQALYSLFSKERLQKAHKQSAVWFVHKADGAPMAEPWYDGLREGAFSNE